jgi:alpha-amylase
MIVWISPVNQNYEGPRTAYGDPYHGYWIADATQLNEHFGTSDDLKALSAEIHRRNMWVIYLPPNARKRVLQLTILL